jgi:hypothetical protein
MYKITRIKTTKTGLVFDIFRKEGEIANNSAKKTVRIVFYSKSLNANHVFFISNIIFKDGIEKDDS